MEIRIMCLCIGILLCTGCTIQPVQHGEGIDYISSKKEEIRQIAGSGYVVEIPKNERFSRTKSAYFTANYPVGIDSADIQNNDYSITIFDTLISQSSHCSPYLTGSSSMKPLSPDRSSILWGQVDKDTGLVHGKYAYAVCMRPSRGDCPRELWETGECNESTSAYALCSEHEGKTIVICIQQYTDNPTMAEDIFRTFRWLP